MFEEYEIVWDEMYEVMKEVVVEEVVKVIEVGGLYVFGIECYEFCCIDN